MTKHMDGSIFGPGQPCFGCGPDHPIGMRLAFEIEDYAATLSKLEQMNVETFALGGKVGQIFVRDPDGNVIELIAPGGKSNRSS